MKNYATPEVRVIFVDEKDIIATSPVPPEEDDDNTTGTTPFMPWG